MFITNVPPAVATGLISDYQTRRMVLKTDIRPTVMAPTVMSMVPRIIMLPVPAMPILAVMGFCIMMTAMVLAVMRTMSTVLAATGDGSRAEKQYKRKC